MKATLAPDDPLTHVDFSESYKNQHQNEIQSAYFGNTTFSLFTACACFRDSTNDHASHHWTAIVTESSEHDRVCTHFFNSTPSYSTLSVFNKCKWDMELPSSPFKLIYPLVSDGISVLVW